MQVGCAVLNLSLVFSVLCEGERPVLGKAFVASNAPTPGILRFTTKTCQKWGCAVKVCMNSGFCCWPVVKYLVKSYGFRAWSYFLHWGSLFFFFFLWIVSVPYWRQWGGRKLKCSWGQVRRPVLPCTWAQDWLEPMGVASDLRGDSVWNGKSPAQYPCYLLTGILSLTWGDVGWGGHRSWVF